MKRLRDLGREAARDDELSPFVATFLRGLSLGALVGAAIAGSALLGRFRRRSNDADPAAPSQRS